MPAGSTYSSPSGPWRLAAQAVMDRAAGLAGPRDYATARLAEHLEREMARAPRLRPEQIAAIRAIVAGG